MIFVDTNIIIDLSGMEGPWAAWSRERLGTARAAGDLVSNHVVMAELAPGFAAAEPLAALFEELAIEILPFTAATAFRSSQAHGAYRAAGGAQQAVLADFLIDGHAAALGVSLLTRDRRRFATYFPELTLITPETDT